ncbi:hypothetical protein E1162_12640 [Rhodobacteraceae bacterium RKSG542]|uniref:DUF6492 family protein n=1 Tax=Pseudovibrio flavus TaxID=2529854 RepID=UPI0012BD239A|nr:hypothetical protein [Pseudovibrio flavus]
MQVNPPTKEPKVHLISVCERGNLDTWKVGSRYILKNVKADTYRVIVPEKQLQLFQENTPTSFSVENENLYTLEFGAKLKKATERDNPQRYGWYLQQLIKLTAAAQFDVDDLVIIWDADTIPLRPINFVSNSGKLSYYRSKEHHKPYFSMIERLLGYPRQTKASFIAQCFPLRVSWLHHFIAEVEAKHEKPWQQAIIDLIDFTEPSGFSEYETLGAFIAHNFNSEITFIRRKWLRFGQELVNSASDLERPASRLLLGGYDHVTFERWVAPPSSSSPLHSIYARRRSIARSLLLYLTPPHFGWPHVPVAHRFSEHLEDSSLENPATVESP